MTRYPQPSDPVSALTRADATTNAHSSDHGMLIDGWENVKSYGVVGDGVADDTAGIQAALDAVLRPSSAKFARTLWFPHGTYKFGALTWYEAERVGANDIWITIQIDGTLKPQATMEIPARRLRIVGRSGAVHQSFSVYGYAEIDGSALGTDSVIRLTSGANSIWLEGLIVKNFLGIGIEIPQGICEVYLTGVFVKQSASATGSYSCVKVGDDTDVGFGYHFNYCGFTTSAESGFGLELIRVGIIDIRNSFFGGKGIKVVGAGAGGMHVHDVLTEDLDGSVLTIDSSAGEVAGIYMLRVEDADSTQVPSCLIKNTGSQTYNVTAETCLGYTRLVEAGSDPLQSVYQNPGQATTGTTIGQDNQYHTKDRFGRLTVAAAFSLGGLTWTSDDTSPSAGEGSFFILSNANPTTITDFDNEIAGQVLFLEFTNGNTTITDGAAISLRGSGNFTGAAGDTMTLISNGTTWYEVARSIAAPSAYTQTYSTADRTHAAPTAAALTVADGAGTNDNTIGAITADASVIAAVQELADEINKLVTDLADTKQMVNAVVDDLQTAGIVR